MRKLTPDVHAKSMMRSLGQQHALQIAIRCMNETMNSTWSSLPTKSIFHAKTKQGEAVLDTKHLVKVHNFWVQMTHILRKAKHA